MKKITSKIMLFLTFVLVAFSMNSQTTYYEDFRYENTGRGFTVQKIALDGQAAGDIGKRMSDIVDAADSSPVFDASSRPSTRTPNGGARDQRGISFKNISGSGAGLTNHEIEAWALMTNQNLSSVNAPKVSFWTQQRSVVGSGSTITVWVSQNYTHGNAPSSATWTNETSNITGAIATAGVSNLTYVKGELDLSAYTGTSVTVAFKIVTDNTAYSAGVSQHGTFYISDVKFAATPTNVLDGLADLNESASGQTNIFSTPSAAINNSNFSNTSKWGAVLSTDNSVPRLANGSLIPAGEGYKFEVASNYNPIVVTEVRYQLVNAASNKGAPDGSKWKVQGSNDDAAWTDLCEPVEMFGSNTGVDVQFPITLNNTTAYRYYRFVLSEAWTPNSNFTALQRLDFVVSSLWTGTTDSDWSTVTNWSTGAVPANNAVITSGLTNYPTIATGTAVTTGNILIESGASLIADGTSTVTSNVTYKRNLSFTAGGLEGWHLVGSPVSGQTYNNDFISANSIATGTVAANRGIAVYDNSVATNNWDYFQNGESGTFGIASGYSMKTFETTDVSFTGTLNTDNADKGINIGAGTPFNLISNPFTAYINSETFLDLAANSTKLTSKTIWVWNPSTKNYDAKISTAAFKVAPGQGFFVSCSTAGDLTFEEGIQNHQTSDTFLRTEVKPQITLNITDSELNRYAKIYYDDNASKSFDNGYDGETFAGVANKFDIFTQLLENNQGKNYQIQSLPNEDLESMVIPVGLKSEAGKEITFTAETLNLPNDIKVFLEDRNANTFTRLDEINSEYKVTLTEAANGIGQFYLHTSKSSLGVQEVNQNNISVYSVNKSTLKIVGLSQGNSDVSLYNILGKKVFSTSFKSNGVQEISLPELARGIYIVQIANKTGKLSKKIVLE